MHSLMFISSVILLLKGHEVIALSGPSFIFEPQSKKEFSNSTGASISCTATGTPLPSIKWMLADGSPASFVPGLREIMPNGTLHFPPFSAEAYRQDIHAISYRCKASNDFGSLVSRAVHVRAVVLQYYEVQVYDEYVIRGNTAVIKCHIPSFVKDYVTVTSWVKYSATRMVSDISSGGRYNVFPTGELHIRNAGTGDSFTSYRCRTRHRLTGETRLSSSQGRLVVSDPQHSVPPRITDSRPILYAREGDTVELPCAAQALPVPRYRWYKSDLSGENPLLIGQRITQLDGSLVVRRITLSDAGKYICIVSNIVGEERVETDLVVTAPLFVYVQPQRQRVDLGRTAVFNCSATGYPISRITWTKDGRQLVNSGKRIQLQSATKLVVRSVRREDEGMYQCFAENAEESAQGASELTLGDILPVFTETFPEQTLQPRQSVSLKCTASGSPKPIVSWTLDGYPVRRSGGILSGDFVGPAGEVISYVNISSVSVDDGGYYECVASNSAGSIKHGARVNVYGLPFVKNMRNMSVVAMDTVNIHCRVGGYPIDAIYWAKDGRRLPFNHRQKVYPNGTLHIAAVNPAVDSGIYVCSVQNKQGQSAEGRLFVSVKVPPLIELFSFAKNLHEGMRTRVYCNIAQGDPPVSITWLKDGRPIPAELGVAVQEVDSYSVTLAIDSISPKHNGNYTCVASNNAAIVNHTAELIVDVPPRWVAEPKDSFVVEGHSVALDCLVEGYPAPQVTWKKAAGDEPTNYQQLWSGPHFQIYENGTLKITKAAVEDRGYYLCQASNGIGAGLSAVVYLNVHVAARLNLHHRNQSVNKGEKVRIPCEAVGDPPLEFTWKKDGEPLATDKASRVSVEEASVPDGFLSAVVISSAQRSDSSTYTCLVSNAFGNDEATIQLLVKEPPEAPTEVRALKVTSRTAALEWKAPYDGNIRITHYIVEYRNTTANWNTHRANVTGDQTKITLLGLQPACTYHIRVIAKNEVGLGEPSKTINITTDEEVPGGPPLDVRVSPISPNALKVAWKPPREDLQHGAVKGYYVGYNIANSSEPYLYKTLEAEKGFNNQCTLDGLRVFTTYSILVQAYNSMGAGPRSDEVIATTLEDVPSMAPQDVQCASVTSQAIRVTWKAVSPASVNGRLLGYKIRYQQIEALNGSDEVKAEEVNETKVTLKHLSKFTNFSIQVMAYNRAGNGIPSELVYCRTNEDAPEEPADIKALVMAPDSILISWKPPTNPNGIIRQYTVYIRTAVTPHGSNTSRISVPPSMHYYKVSGLSRGHRYEFWVTASTGAGEGDATRVVAQTPNKWAAARISSFSNHIRGKVGHGMDIPCRAVGIPSPTIEWRISGMKIEENDRITIMPSGSLRIDNVQKSDEGNYSCYVHNVYGADEVTFFLGVQVPPLPPTLEIESTTSTSITVSWKMRETEGNQVKAYELYYKLPYGEWEYKAITPVNSTYTLRDVRCGSHYQLYMLGRNEFGKGNPSDVVSTRTEGREPVPPERDDFIVVNVTSITLQLRKWKDGGCPMSHLAIEYRNRDATQWTVVTTNIKQEEGPLTLHDLKPQTWYQIKVTAYNSAGSTVAEYDIQTLAVATGGKATPELIIHNDAPSAFYEEAAIIIPVVISVLVLILLAVLFIVLSIRKRRPAAKTNGQLMRNNLSTDANLSNADRKSYGPNSMHPLSRLNSFSRPTDSSAYAVVSYQAEEDSADPTMQRKSDGRAKSNSERGEISGVYSVAQRISSSQKIGQSQNSNAGTPRYATSEEFLSLIQQRRQDAGGISRHEWSGEEGVGRMPLSHKVVISSPGVKENNSDNHYFPDKDRVDVYPLCQFSTSPESKDPRHPVCVTPDSLVEDDEFAEEFYVSKTRHWMEKARGQLFSKKVHRENNKNQCESRPGNVTSLSLH